MSAGTALQIGVFAAAIIAGALLVTAPLVALLTNGATRGWSPLWIVPTCLTYVVVAATLIVWGLSNWTWWMHWATSLDSGP